MSIHQKTVIFQLCKDSTQAVGKLSLRPTKRPTVSEDLTAASTYPPTDPPTPRVAPEAPTRSPSGSPPSDFPTSPPTPPHCPPSWAADTSYQSRDLVSDGGGSYYRCRPYPKSGPLTSAPAGDGEEEPYSGPFPAAFQNKTYSTGSLDAVGVLGDDGTMAALLEVTADVLGAVVENTFVPDSGDAWFAVPVRGGGRLWGLRGEDRRLRVPFGEGEIQLVDQKRVSPLDVSSLLGGNQEQGGGKGVNIGDDGPNPFIGSDSGSGRNDLNDNVFSQSFLSTSSDEDISGSISGSNPNDPKDQWREVEVLQQNQQQQFQQH